MPYVSGIHCACADGSKLRTYSHQHHGQALVPWKPRESLCGNRVAQNTGAMDWNWRNSCNSMTLLFLAGIWSRSALLEGLDGHRNGRALLIIDMQGCFLPGGALPVQLKDTNALVTKINNLRTVGGYDVVVFTQDYHPANHISFAAVHHKQPAEMVQLQYTADALICDMEHLYPEASFPCSNNSSNIALQSSRRSPLGGGAGETAMHTVQQMLWPEHCVQNNEQVALHPALLIRPHDILVRKGWKAHLDAYSAFLDNGEVESTGLADLLHQRGITSVTVVGVALDYCVLWSALDAVKLGFNTSVVLEATAPVSAGGGAEAERRLRDAGVQLQQYVWDVAES